jgi:Protein of unknown function (DUF2796)
MRMSLLLLLGLALVAPAHTALAQHRELGAHEHGRGTLNIALEGARLSMEFEAPGADIVGFEHPAKTSQQKAAVEKAKKQLAAPQALFKLPPSAGCVLQEAKVAIESEDHDHAAGKEPADHDEHEHSAFNAQYAFNCKAPTNITAIEFGYFQAFRGAQTLDVSIVTAKAQTKLEATRAKPRIDLAGIW